MSISISDSVKTLRKYRQEDIERFKSDRFVIPETDKWVITSESSHILIQEKTVGDFQLVMLCGNTNEDVAFQYSFETGGFLFSFMPRIPVATEINEHKYSMQGKGKYSVVYSADGCGIGNFSRETHIMVQLYINMKALVALRTSYPRIPDFLCQVSKEGVIRNAMGVYPIDTDLWECIRRIITCKFTGHLADKYLDIRISELLFDFNKQLTNFHAHTETANSISDVQLLYEVMHFIDIHLQKPLQLGDIMKAYHISEYKAKKIFMEINKTFTDYLIESRMKKAMKLLIQTSDKIAAISRDVGYSSASKFSYAFHRYYGIFPREVRSNLTGKNM
ncbi:helix-turn-helix transcriptional regulator [Chitinophaga sp. Mgbs1]|uniref:Helix-turn-helix transcriptional regulator n=1 Tax=Chitinophaga solisilvae TaxID=1233460 RepID=A0A3S1B3J3_9BACT|nr:helix-turn-helix transcriptional regulator [Chitinophaga solisilvae]